MPSSVEKSHSDRYEIIDDHVLSLCFSLPTFLVSHFWNCSALEHVCVCRVSFHSSSILMCPSPVACRRYSAPLPALQYPLSDLRLGAGVGNKSSRPGAFPKLSILSLSLTFAFPVPLCPLLDVLPGHHRRRLHNQDPPLSTPSGEPITLQVWHIAGQERFSSLAGAFFRGAEPIVLMYEVTALETFCTATQPPPSISILRHPHLSPS